MQVAHLSTSTTEFMTPLDRTWNAEEIAILQEFLFTPRPSLELLQQPQHVDAFTWNHASAPCTPVTPSTNTPTHVADVEIYSPAPPTAKHEFKTLTSMQCLQRIHKSFELLTAIKQRMHAARSTDNATAPCMSLSPMGWVIQRPKLEASLSSKLKGMTPPTCFLLEKAIPAQNVQTLMHKTWQQWTDPVKLMRLHPSKQIELEIFQRFNGDGLIIRQENCSINPLNGAQIRERSVYLLFRIQTKLGYTICAHSLDTATLQARLKSSNVTPMTSVFHWITFSALEGNGDGSVHVEFGCTLKDNHYTNFGNSNTTSVAQQSEVSREHEIQEQLAIMSRWEAAVTEMNRPRSATTPSMVYSYLR